MNGDHFLPQNPVKIHNNTFSKRCDYVFLNPYFKVYSPGMFFLLTFPFTHYFAFHFFRVCTCIDPMNILKRFFSSSFWQYTYMLAPKLKWLTKLALNLLRQSWHCQKTLTNLSWNKTTIFQFYLSYIMKNGQYKNSEHIYCKLFSPAFSFTSNSVLK